MIKKKEAMYKMIANKIKNYIQSNGLAVGVKLPSIRYFAGLFEVNINIVIDALDELKNEGIVESKVRSGFYVSPEGYSCLFSDVIDWKRIADKGHLQSRDNTINFDMFKESASVPSCLGNHFGATEVVREIMLKLTKKQNIFETFSREWQGPLVLREDVCLHLKRYAIDAKPEEVFITNGCVEALNLIRLSMMRFGTELICDMSYFSKNDPTLRSYGIKRTLIPHTSQGIDIAKMKTIISKSKNSIIISSFGTNDISNNINNEPMQKETKLKLLKMCHTAGVPIVEYDYWRDLLPQNMHSLRALDETNTVIHIGDFSRPFLQNLHFGWIVAPEIMIDKIADAYCQTEGRHDIITCSIVHEMLGSEGLYYKYIEQARYKIAHDLKQVSTIMDTYLNNVAYWRVNEYNLTAKITFNDDIDVRKLFANKGDLRFIPQYMFNNESSQNIYMGLLCKPLNEFEESVRQLAYIAKQLSR